MIASKVTLRKSEKRQLTAVSHVVNGVITPFSHECTGDLPTRQVVICGSGKWNETNDNEQETIREL